MSLLTQTQVARFHDDGFLIVENLLSDAIVQQLVARIDPLFAGEFETGVFPDEWYWNPHLGLPNASAQMSNVWKSDRALASVVLSAKIGQMSAELSGWSGSRLMSDSLWMKPYGASETTLHQDSMYNFYHTPQDIVVCWIALSQAIPGGSTIEYVRGSHRWTLSDAVTEFHAVNQGYRAAMEQAAQQVGIAQPAVSLLEMSAGSCVFHHGHMWHGSNKNLMPDTVRRSLVVAHVPANARFKPTGAYVQGGYLPGRYKRYGDDTMDEGFFPIVWQQDGYRTPFLADYCQDALAASLVATR
ncbi:MAG: phytanoyl-CoA dioxygenase family protein [Verrucomicrobia bacterium]|nr:phytanoyl-CoA dioxygenase family protein [Leptolyngbya sp. ES-bin-22]